MDEKVATREAERLQAEENLRVLQDEYQQSLALAEAERERVREEAAARESKLRSQLDARTEELEQATLEAREELNRLAAQQEKQTLAAGQLSGFYSRVKGDIQEEDFDQALEDLDSIREYLDDPSVATLPNILQRREIELFAQVGGRYGNRASKRILDFHIRVFTLSPVCF